MPAVTYSDKQLKECAETITWYYVKHNDYPQLFIYENELHFDPNSRQFGRNAAIYWHGPECTIIFGREQLDELIVELEIDTDNLSAYEAIITQTIYNRLVQLMNELVHD